MKKIKKYNGLIRGIKILVFGGTLAVMCIIGLLWFLRPDTSVVEKRTLTEFPKIAWSSFWDGSFFSQLDTWYSDTYPLRESLISANQTLQDHYGIRSNQIVGNTTIVADEIPDISATPAASPSVSPSATVTPSPSPSPSEESLEDGTITDIGEMQGNIYITDNSGYGLYYFDQDGADTFVQTVNQFYENVKDKVNLYVMIVPISAGVMLDQSVLDDMGSSDESKALDYIYSQLNAGIHTVSVFENLKKHNAEYIYFHTDHHWTQLGAYYAYEVFCEEKGLTPNNPEDFETIEFDNFMGTFYSSSNQSQELASNPDTVTAYIPNGTNDMVMQMSDGQSYDWKIINDVSDYPNTELYATFAGGDNPFSYAHNESITDGSSVVVIKDSYGNAFIPWLVDHYEHIYWIDVRYTSNTISQMVEDYGIQDVIIELHIYNGSSNSVTAQLASIGQ